MRPTEPEAAIVQMYEEDAQPVPYPVFMKCFNKLLKDPQALEPAEPSDALEESFRAVCMALDVGLRDTLERGEDRERDFRDHIYPVWTEWLSEEKLARYKRILDGKARRQRRREEWEKLRRLARQEDEERARAEEEARARRSKEFEKLTAEALARRGADPGIEVADSARQRPQGSGRVAVYRDAVALSKAVARGDLPATYRPPADKAPFALYAARDGKVRVRLVKGRKTCLVLLCYPLGKGVQLLEDGGLEQSGIRRGYSSLGRGSLVKHMEGAALKVRLAGRTLNVAVEGAAPLQGQQLSDAILLADEELQSLLAANLSP